MQEVLIIIIGAESSPSLFSPQVGSIALGHPLLRHTAPVFHVGLALPLSPSAQALTLDSLIFFVTLHIHSVFPFALFAHLHTFFLRVTTGKSSSFNTFPFNLRHISRTSRKAPAIFAKVSHEWSLAHLLVLFFIFVYVSCI